MQERGIDAACNEYEYAEQEEDERNESAACYDRAELYRPAAHDGYHADRKDFGKERYDIVAEFRKRIGNRHDRTKGRLIAGTRAA